MLTPSDRSILVVRPGLLTTVQDRGRWGWQTHGVPVAGPMDGYSHRLANRLVGNRDDAAALEITLTGPELRAEGDLWCVVAGADFGVQADGQSVAQTRPFHVPSGGSIRFRERRAGARATLAVSGGITVPIVFGSRATGLAAGIGPLGGRALKAGDRLPIGEPAPARQISSSYPMTLPRGGARVRALPGPHESAFPGEALRTFFSSRFVLAATSNRMGYRLDGPSLPRGDAAEILSDATPFGSVQVPASGAPILLMADRQTTGGYPKIATVISADLPLAGQLAPGDWIEFAACTLGEALDALRLQERRLAGQSR